MLKKNTTIKLINNPKRGITQLIDDEIQIAEVNYRILDDKLLCIDHTFVNPDFRNEGYGNLIISKLENIAQKEGLKIFPICPFAKDILSQKIGKNQLIKKAEST
ncbi:GNAT family N-acetyltransferase [Aquiflexum lacus]|uniref:GNAT family N-acetyltransferase n=1 Tax=Aquiflexum lacus TaxID=2483805 RepID=UPI001895A444|nr:GNAT family N-acetyltransferase [Aquiflexum lacus]